MRKFYLVSSFVFLFNLSFAQSWQDTVKQIETVVSKYYQPGTPGLQLSISRNGEIIFSKAWGMADMERQVPLTSNSILEAGSVSKQFTAAAILLLEQQGKLSINDDVRKYIPELPDYGYTIRLRHLLHHTSGLRDWGNVADLTGWGRGTKFYSNNDALEIIAHQKRLNNKPGDEYIYSNSNYNLLAIIVQRVSGLSLADFTKKYIFEPAQMLYTSWRDNPNRIVPNRAIAYSSTGNDFQTNMPNEYVYGNGGLLTTTEDLLKWNNFYLAEKLGGSSLLKRQTLTEPFNNGVAAEYAAGLQVQKIGGWNTLSHGGATAGYRAYLIFYPDLKLSIAILSNTPQNFTAVMDTIPKLFVTDRAEKQNVQVASYKPSEAALKNYNGWYKNERDGTGFKLTVKKDSLFAYKIPLQAVAENKFRVGIYELLMNGKKGLYLIIPGKDTINYTRAETASLSTNQLREYEGTFFSGETISSVIISIVKDSISMRLKPDEVYTLMPLYKDAFQSLEGKFTLYFIRDRNGKVQKLKISVDRARNVEFEKVK